MSKNNKGNTNAATPAQRFSAQVNWLNFQLNGAHGNIRAASNQIGIDCELIDQLTDSDRELLTDIHVDIQLVLDDLKVLREKVAKFNREKFPV